MKHGFTNDNENVVAESANAQGSNTRKDVNEREMESISARLKIIKNWVT